MFLSVVLLQVKSTDTRERDRDTR